MTQSNRSDHSSQTSLHQLRDQLRKWTCIKNASRNPETWKLTRLPLQIYWRRRRADAADVHANLVLVPESAVPSPAYIHTLPPELLGEIFIHCLSSMQGLYITIRDAPMLLCQICGHWRQVALSLPVLWSNFRCNLGHEAKASHARLLQLFVDRSHRTPLSLALTPAPGLDATMKVLLANLYRWHDVRVDLDAEFGQLFLGILCEEPLQLESVDVTTCARNWDVDQLISRLSGLPSLRRLRWGADFLPPSLLNTAWPRLTDIKIAGRLLSINDSITMLSNTPAVEHAALGFVDTSSETLTYRPLITLQRLRSLEFHAYDADAILNNFTFPSLLSLATSQPHDRHVLRRLGERSSWRLEVFNMIATLDAEEAIFYLRLPSMQSVTSLGLNTGAGNDEIMTFLTRNPEIPFEAAILPYLTRLNLTVEKTADGAIGKIIVSRWLPQNLSAGLPASLKNVKSWFHDDWPFEHGVEYHPVDIAYFTHLAQEGLDISWDCGCSVVPL
ncbi:hypothetical protein Hypma_016515 [Hypsizygus marmoreus]|uniref:F-box domain-containing protein n=1 Tax=Hypsizygus marmoreus TaxID=39966 RepID=A0A369IYP1_HYPMA|nr:hypothetical protein Hypma_016515 [Hypsizygus marmoreus]